MTSRNASDHARCSTCGGWQTAEFPNGDIAHCPTCQRGCICMTAADLGFSGWGDGVNPNLIAATHPECPEHGFRAVPCSYDGCPYPTNPQYNHNHPQDYWSEADL